MGNWDYTRYSKIEREATKLACCLSYHESVACIWLCGCNLLSYDFRQFVPNFLPTLSQPDLWLWHFSSQTMTGQPAAAWGNKLGFLQSLNSAGQKRNHLNGRKGSQWLIREGRPSVKPSVWQFKGRYRYRVTALHKWGGAHQTSNHLPKPNL